MEGDFTRNSDDPEASYSGVLMQQGRVQLDADWNEQRAIQTRALRSALRDLIGRHGGPAGDGLGFAINLVGTNNPTIQFGPGVYYVDGIRVWERRKDSPIALPQASGTPIYLAFLDVWERHVNAIEDPRIREVALLGPDTATRAEIVWRVRLLRCTTTTPSNSPDKRSDTADAAEKMIDVLRNRPRRGLAARASTANPTDDRCKLSPMAQFRGEENQLYRVEIHDAGAGGDTPPALRGGAPTADAGEVLFSFKWSRDNGANAIAIAPVIVPDPPQPGAPNDQLDVTVTLGSLGRDDRSTLVAGDIVEFVNDATTRGTPPRGDDAIEEGARDPGVPGLLGRVTEIDRDAMTARITVFAPDLAEFADASLHPYLRRWDQRDAPGAKLVEGAVPVRMKDLGGWLALEDGVEIKFEAPSNDHPALEQRAGDYWQIPARVATGNVLWPQDKPTAAAGSAAPATPRLVAPHGPDHHYAPLAFVFANTASATAVVRVRRSFAPLAALALEK